jgi:hypothetical protein
MSDRDKLPFRYVFGDLLKHFVAVLMAAVGLWFVNYTIQAVAPGVAKYVQVLTVWALLAMISFFLFNLLFQLIYRVYLPIQQALALATNQTRPYQGPGWLSWIAGFLGFIVVFALIHRALVTVDGVSKLLIFIAAFLLGFEVILMISREVKTRTIASILAITQGSQTRALQSGPRFG